MRAILALIRFELERRALALVMAGFSGLAALALPYLPGDPSTVPAAMLRELAAAIAAVLYVGFLACALGASLLASDLAERRATFHFARPVAAGAVLVARFVASFTLLLASALLILLPTWIVDSSEGAGPRLNSAGAIRLVLLAVAIVGALLPLASAVALAARARTAWVIVEIACLVAGALMVVRSFETAGATELEWPSITLAAALALAGGVSLFAAQTYGRTDVSRAHRAQVAVLAPLLLAIGVGALAWMGD